MAEDLRVEAEHGVVCSLPHERFGYFGWPSVARMEDGTLVVASSGLRRHHVCPWGKTVLNLSHDEGKTWSPPIVINNTPLDDRDAGVVSLGGQRLLLSWFTSDTRQYLTSAEKSLGLEESMEWRAILGLWSDELVSQWLGSWVRLSDDGKTWGPPIRVPVNTPHGPIRLARGDLLYFGKGFRSWGEMRSGAIETAASDDEGKTWTVLGAVPPGEGVTNDNFHEPHVAELPSGKLIGMIRYQHAGESKAHPSFSLFQTESADGGATWSAARFTGVYGSPPHLLRHSSGALVCVYGYRQKPFGQRAMISRNEGATWQADFVLRDDGPDSDLGYPASVELPDGRLFTVYYQKCAARRGGQAGENCSLLWTCWRLPA